MDSIAMHGKKRMNVEHDRLSSLPDELIHKILSFMRIKHAIQTCVLSSRWRFIWTLMPYLNFSRDDFVCLSKFSEFVTHVLSCRNNQIGVSSVKLSFHGEDSDAVVKQIMTYAFSQNIQQLNIACSFDMYFGVMFPLFLSSCRSLKHLSVTKEDFSGANYYRKDFLSYHIKTASTWEFPALTTLHLEDVFLRCDRKTDKCVSFFSNCANLKNLTLKDCLTIGSDGLSICLPLLSSLTLEDVRGSVKVFNIVAPQLKNLTIRDSFLQDLQCLVSAPDLLFFLYKGYYCLQLSNDGFGCLKKADICVPRPINAHQVLCLLQQLHSVKFLKLNLEIVELLSSSAEPLSHQASPFANLKSLKIHPARQKHNGVKMSAEVKHYLLDSSPGAAFTMVSREDIRDMGAAGVGEPEYRPKWQRCMNMATHN